MMSFDAKKIAPAVPPGTDALPMPPDQSLVSCAMSSSKLALPSEKFLLQNPRDPFDALKQEAFDRVRDEVEQAARRGFGNTGPDWFRGNGLKESDRFKPGPRQIGPKEPD